ncbi:hypothetical protein HPP92_016282 [Vanilla planifolia]|uniref:Uncharacterized protein n=1 Tax=Vanilla planifolia TaxID=51239 RepID=A0A835UPU5_VANPL|nr:hypothetical protein HPP92_016282 [Vanilla planifolia]
MMLAYDSKGYSWKYDASNVIQKGLIGISWSEGMGEEVNGNMKMVEMVAVLKDNGSSLGFMGPFINLITSKSMPVINSKKILGQEYIYLSFALAPLGSEYRKLIEGSIVDKI